jgi:hypothetical protein
LSVEGQTVVASANQLLDLSDRTPLAGFAIQFTLWPERADSGDVMGKAHAAALRLNWNQRASPPKDAHLDLLLECPWPFNVEL